MYSQKIQPEKYNAKINISKTLFSDVLLIYEILVISSYHHNYFLIYCSISKNFSGQRKPVVDVCLWNSFLFNSTFQAAVHYTPFQKLYVYL